MLTQAVVGVEADLHWLPRRSLLRLITDLNNVIVGVRILHGDVLLRHPLQLLVEQWVEDSRRRRRRRWRRWRLRGQSSLRCLLCRFLPLHSLPHQPVHLRHGQELDIPVAIVVALARPQILLRSFERSVPRRQRRARCSSTIDVGVKIRGINILRQRSGDPLLVAHSVLLDCVDGLLVQNAVSIALALHMSSDLRRICAEYFL